MSKLLKSLILVFIFLFISTSLGQANSLEPYVVLQAENGDLIGESLVRGGNDNLRYVSVVSGAQQDDLLAMLLDIHHETSYEIWVRVQGTGSAKLMLFTTNQQIYQENFRITDSNWHWIKVKKILKLNEGRYYTVLTDFSGSSKIDKVVVKKVSYSEESLRSSSASEPTLPNEGPWVKQGLNPFASLIQNGNEAVSTTSGILTIVATDVKVPGRNGLDLNISRTYNSKTHNKDRSDISYLVNSNNQGWDLGFPKIDRGNVYFPNGSVCDYSNEDVSESTQHIGKDKKITYENSKVRYFRLIRYDKYTGLLFLIPQYETDYYQLYLPDGRCYHFDGEGRIQYIQGKNPNNKIEFFYDSDKKLVQIKDTVGRIYDLVHLGNKIEIIRQADSKRLVSYTFSQNELLVKDILERTTRYGYGSSAGITSIDYPSGKTSYFHYKEDKYSHSWTDENGETHSFSHYLYWVITQSLYVENDEGNKELVRSTLFQFNFEDQSRRKIRHCKAKTSNEKDELIFSTYYNKNDKGLIVRTKTIDEKTQKIIRTAYTDYNFNQSKINEAVYYGNIYDQSYDSHISDSIINVDKKTKEEKWLLSEELWEYDTYGNLVYHQDPLGYETMISYVNCDYDSFYRVGSEGGSTFKFYDNSGLDGSLIHNLPAGQLKIKDYLNSERTQFTGTQMYYQYDSKGNLLESKTLAKDEYGADNWLKTKYSDYDIYGNCGKTVVNSDNLNPITIQFKYGPEYNHAYLTERTQTIKKNLVDDLGNLISGKQCTVKYEYDFLSGNQLKIIDLRGHEVIYEYDPIGRVKKVTYPKTASETVATYEEVIYDDMNNLVKVHDGERKNVIIHYFDGVGRKVKVERYSDLTGKTLDSKISSVYNWQNQVIKSIDENEIETVFEYDLFGRNTKISTIEEGEVTVLSRTSYDDLLRTATTLNQNDIKQIMITDKKGQTVKTIKENEGEELLYQYEYDGFGNVVKTTDPKNQEMGYIYNDLGQLSKLYYPDQLGQVYSYDVPNHTVYNFYDNFGRIKRTVDRNSQTMYYEYNEYNQLTKVNLPISDDINYYYNELGQLIKVRQNNKFEKVYSYDARGRVKSETLSDLASQKTYETDYIYNKNNQLMQTVYPNSAGTLNYNYNSLNQINQVKWNESHLVNSVDYLKTGHLSDITYGNNVLGSFNYDFVNGHYIPNHIAYKQGSDHLLGVYDYSYDNLGNIIRANDHLYEYDDLNQLIGWKFLQDNQQVLLGEEVIWEKQMSDHKGLELNGTFIHSDNLRLATELGHGVSEVSRLLKSMQVTSASNLETTTNDGYSLKRDYLVYNESFVNLNGIDTSKTTAEINLTNKNVILPKNQGTTQWVSVFTKDINPDLVLSKTAGKAINVVAGSSTPNTSYSGYQYAKYDGWKPPTSDNVHWKTGPTLNISRSKLVDVKKIRLDVSALLNNSYRIFGGGWGNWTMWLRIKINGKYIDMIPYRTNSVYKETQYKYKDIDLSKYNLVNVADGLTISTSWTVNRWGAGSTHGGQIKTLKVTGKEKLVYPVNSNKYVAYQVSLKKGTNYRFEANDSIPSYTKVTYQLKGSFGTKTLVNNPNYTFTVPKDEKCELRITLNTTNEGVSPIVRNVKISRELIYQKSATLLLKQFNLSEKCRSIAIEYHQVLEPGTSINYLVSNDGGISWKTPEYSSTLGNYVANFTNPGDKVLFKAILQSDQEQRYTPIISSVKITILDSGKYRLLGTILTRDLQIVEPSNMVILELHGKKNGGSFKVSMDINGQTLVGKATTALELMEYLKYNNDPNGGTPVAGYINLSSYGGSTDSQKITDAEMLRLELSMKNLQVYYYRFNLPEEETKLAFTTQLKIELEPTSDQLSSPNVYSFILFNNPLKYYTIGTFNTKNYLTSKTDYTFDKIRLDVVEEIESSTTTKYEGFDFGSGSGSNIDLTPGVTIPLEVDTDFLKIRGILKSSQKTNTPKIYQMNVTAIGEVPLKNDLDSISDIDYKSIPDNTLRASTDSVIGNYSLLIDHTVSGNAYYKIDQNHYFDACKLPVVKIWVKPLTNSSIRFSTWDASEERYEYLTSSLDGDIYYEVGEDLKLNQWNLVLLDLRHTNGGGIVKDARGLNVYLGNGSKYLVDGLDSIPFNEASFVYDQAGNRIKYIENGTMTTYDYELGSNRLKQKNNQYEDTYYTYDYNGNLIRQEIISEDSYYFDYVYNELNQLVEVKRNGATIAAYHYDHAGIRYKKVDYLAKKTTIYVYGTGTEPIYEEIYGNDDLNAPVSKVSYLFIDTKRIAKAEGSSVSYYYTDHLGSTWIVDSTGECSYYHYKPFGIDFEEVNTERYKFTGKEDDGATGLYYYNARYYDPGVGRFINEDPVKDGENWYLYCRNNPLRYVDPHGLEIAVEFYVTSLEKNKKRGVTARGYMYVTNPDTGFSFRFDGVKSGGLENGTDHSSTPAPFGTYDILNLTMDDQILYHRLEAQDDNYGDDKAAFAGQKTKTELRLHGPGSDTTYGCISVPKDMDIILARELERTTTSTVMVRVKFAIFKDEKEEEQIKYGTLKIIDKTLKEK